VPQRLFGVFMSVHPVLAGLAGIVLLGQVLHLHEWAGIGIVVVANAVAVAAAGRPFRPTAAPAVAPASAAPV
jgi:inner membrane transporter RhtA